MTNSSLGLSKFTPLLTKQQPVSAVRVEDYIEQIDKAFETRNNFYNNFVKQDMKELDRELFPLEKVHSADINPMYVQKNFTMKLQNLKYKQRLASFNET